MDQAIYRASDEYGILTKSLLCVCEDSLRADRFIIARSGFSQRGNNAKKRPHRREVLGQLSEKGSLLRGGRRRWATRFSGSYESLSLSDGRRADAIEILTANIREIWNIMQR